MDRVIAAAIQMQSGDDRDLNLESAAGLIDQAVGAGARIIALPELFSLWGPPELQREHAEPLTGPTVIMLKAKAGQGGAYMIGGLAERGPDPTGKVYNTSVLIDPAGEILAVYRKIHLFDVDVAGHVVKESDNFLPGDMPVVTDTEFGKVGLTVCYDLRFPELYRTLAVEGAQMVFVVSSFLASTGKHHWEPLLRARAIENQFFVVAPNETGPIPGSHTKRYGHSAIIDPWGNMMAQASDGDCVVTAELDFSYLREVRKRIPSLASRQPAVYRNLSAS